MSEPKDTANTPQTSQKSNAKVNVEATTTTAKQQPPPPPPQTYAVQDVVLRDRSTQMLLTCTVAKSENWLKSKISKESELYRKSMSASSLAKKNSPEGSGNVVKKKEPTAARKKRAKKKSMCKKRLDAEENAECLKPGPGLLLRAQAAEQTLTGLHVMKGTVNQIVTLERQERMKANPFTPNKIRMLLEPPFCDMSVITPYLGLTGLGGIVIDRFAVFENPVKCIISVTYESPLFEVEGIESFRVPVADDKKENISIYFDDVTEKIEQVKSAKATTIVHCMAGVSRSASMVMAYLIRFEKMTLRNAFQHVKTRRSVVTPNTAFLEQLVAYEKKHHEHQSQQPLAQLVEHTINGITQRLPDFVVEEWLNEYMPLFEPE